MKEIDWSKAPEGATHYALDQNGRPVFYKDIGDEGYFFWWPALDEWRKNHGKPGYEPMISKQWSGAGLPPAGVTCEYQINDKWNAITVVAHVNEYGKKLAVFQFADGETWSSGGCVERFRPIRTPEQIAEEERDREVDEMIALIGDVGDNPSWPDIAAALHEAGYRKQVQP